MTKLEQLKAAFEAATPGEWGFVIADNAELPHSIVVDKNGEDLLKHRYGVTMKAQNDVDFIALAHNLMPTLLEAVELLAPALKIIDAYRKESGGDVPITAMNIRATLEKLK